MVAASPSCLSSSTETLPEPSAGPGAAAASEAMRADAGAEAGEAAGANGEPPGGFGGLLGAPTEILPSLLELGIGFAWRGVCGSEDAVSCLRGVWDCPGLQQGRWIQYCCIVPRLHMTLEGLPELPAVLQGDICALQYSNKSPSFNQHACNM